MHDKSKKPRASTDDGWKGKSMLHEAISCRCKLLSSVPHILVDFLDCLGRYRTYRDNSLVFRLPGTRLVSLNEKICLHGVRKNVSALCSIELALTYHDLRVKPVIGTVITSEA